MGSASQERRNRRENACHVLEQIQSWGVVVPPASRLVLMQRALSRNDPVPPSESGFEVVLEAERDLGILGFVFDQANRIEDREGFLRCVRKVVKDPVLPQENLEKSDGRDAQFEMLVGAVCQKAEMHPVRFDEPDVTCVFDGVKYGIAAKRLKNAGNIDSRVKKAIEQIGRSGLPGVIALDVSVALNRDNLRITECLPHENFGQLLQDEIGRFREKHALEIMGRVGSVPAIGVLFMYHQVRMWTPTEWGLDTMTCPLGLIGDTAKGDKEFRMLWESFKTGLPGLRDLNESTTA